MRPMYTPKAFAMDDIQACIRFVRRESFGILSAAVAGRPFATHLPMLLSEDGHTLRGHIASANPQWRELDGSDVRLARGKGTSPAAQRGTKGTTEELGSGLGLGAGARGCCRPAPWGWGAGADI